MPHFVNGNIFEVDGACDGLFIAGKSEFKPIKDYICVNYVAIERVGIDAGDGYDTRSAGSL